MEQNVSFNSGQESIKDDAQYQKGHMSRSVTQNDAIQLDKGDLNSERSTSNFSAQKQQPNQNKIIAQLQQQITSYEDDIFQLQQEKEKIQEDAVNFECQLLDMQEEFRKTSQANTKLQNDSYRLNKQIEALESICDQSKLAQIDRDNISDQKEKVGVDQMQRTLNTITNQVADIPKLLLYLDEERANNSSTKQMLLETEKKLLDFKYKHSLKTNEAKSMKVENDRLFNQSECLESEVQHYKALYKETREEKRKDELEVKTLRGKIDSLNDVVKQLAQNSSQYKPQSESTNKDQSTPTNNTGFKFNLEQCHEGSPQRNNIFQDQVLTATYETHRSNLGSAEKGIKFNDPELHEPAFDNSLSIIHADQMCSPSPNRSHVQSGFFENEQFESPDLHKGQLLDDEDGLPQVEELQELKTQANEFNEINHFQLGLESIVEETPSPKKEEQDAPEQKSAEKPKPHIAILNLDAVKEKLKMLEEGASHDKIRDKKIVAFQTERIELAQPMIQTGRTCGSDNKKGNVERNSNRQSDLNSGSGRRASNKGSTDVKFKKKKSIQNMMFSGPRKHAMFATDNLGLMTCGVPHDIFSEYCQGDGISSQPAEDQKSSQVAQQEQIMKSTVFGSSLLTGMDNLFNKGNRPPVLKLQQYTTPSPSKTSKVVDYRRYKRQTSAFNQGQPNEMVSEKSSEKVKTKRFSLKLDKIPKNDQM